MTRWQPRIELTCLLDALSEDIVAADDEEVQQMHGRTIASTAREVRRVIDAARADRKEGARADVGRDLSEYGAGARPVRGLRRPAHQQRH